MNASTVSTIIALISLGVSVATWVFTHLSPSRIKVFMGPNVLLSNPSSDQVTMTVPVSFSNLGAQVGNVIRAAAVIYHIDSPSQLYFMLWDSFTKLDYQPTARWIHEELVHALVVPGRSTVVKTVLFAWFQTADSRLVFREGTYRLVFLYWTSEGNPYREDTRIVISAPKLQALQDKGEAAARSVFVQLDERLKGNQTLNEHDFGKLFGRGL